MLKTYKHKDPAFFEWSAAASAVLVVLVALVLTGGALGAQQISGRVLSGEDNQPIGAAVVRFVGGEVWETTMPLVPTF